MSSDKKDQFMPALRGWLPVAALAAVASIAATEAAGPVMVAAVAGVAALGLTLVNILRPPNKDSSQDLDLHVLEGEVIARFYEILSRLMSLRTEGETSLRKVINFTEKSSSGIGDCINKINGIAGAQLKDAMEICEQFKASSGQQVTLASVMDQTTKHLNDLLTILSNIIAENEDLSRSLQGASESTSKISENSQRVRALAMNSRLLAFNAYLEASRAGEQGRGFRVVAEEFNKLAVEAAEMAHGIDEVSRKITTDVDNMCNALLARNKVTSSKQKNLQVTIEEIIGTTNRSKSEAREIAERALHGSREIAQNINEVISHLQFQDITRQEIEKHLWQTADSWGPEFKDRHDLRRAITVVADQLNRAGLTEEAGYPAFADAEIRDKHSDDESKHTSTFGEVVMFGRKSKSGLPHASAVEGTPLKDASAGDVVIF